MWAFFVFPVYPCGRSVLNKPRVLSCWSLCWAGAVVVAGRGTSCSWEPARGLAALCPQLPEFSSMWAGTEAERALPSSSCTSGISVLRTSAVHSLAWDDT